jgi:hypothetical protein
MKSSFSDTTNCVDVELVDPETHARDKGGQEVAVVVRDTKGDQGSGAGHELWFTATEWDAFLAGVKAGEFDRDRMPLGERTQALTD